MYLCPFVPKDLFSFVDDNFLLQDGPEKGFQLVGFMKLKDRDLALFRSWDVVSFVVDKLSTLSAFGDP